ncbi:MAG: hypothetical protein JKX94_08955 [Sneathiella sp.]|nr:hypothetical protein [Sneathiella sp.]
MSFLKLPWLTQTNLSEREIGSGEITESRIETAMQRIDAAAEAILKKPSQRSFSIGDDPILKAEIDSLRVENQLLRQELLETTKSYDALKQTSNIVSVRLDKTIDDISLMLEQ